MTQPWEADHALSAATVEAMLPSIAPDLAGSSVRSLGEGWDYRAYIASDTILRFAKRAEVGERLRAEAALCALASSRLPLAVPQLEAHGPSEHAPHGFTRHPRLPGRALKDFEPTPRKLRWIAVRLGVFIGALHAIPASDAIAAGALPVGHDATPAGAARRSLARLSSLAPRLPRPVVDATQRLLASPPRPGAGDTFIHGDLWPEHVLVDESSLEPTGVIDWGDAVVGDAAEDFAAAWFLAGDEGLNAALGAADTPPNDALLQRARFFGVHHAIGDAWFAAEQGRPAEMAWALAALQRLA